MRNEELKTYKEIMDFYMKRGIEFEYEVQFYDNTQLAGSPKEHFDKYFADNERGYFYGSEVAQLYLYIGDKTIRFAHPSWNITFAYRQLHDSMYYLLDIDKRTGKKIKDPVQGKKKKDRRQKKRPEPKAQWVIA